MQTKATCEHRARDKGEPSWDSAEPSWRRINEVFHTPFMSTVPNVSSSCAQRVQGVGQPQRSSSRRALVVCNLPLWYPGERRQIRLQVRLQIVPNTKSSCQIEAKPRRVQILGRLHNVRNILLIATELSKIGSTSFLTTGASIAMEKHTELHSWKFTST